MSKKHHYPDVDANPDFAALEEKTLKFWAESRAFEKSVEMRPAQGNNSSNSYVFYDGPPFANGLPHYGHLLTGYVKDAIARYQTMRGKRVERRFGWDCHGLPAEMGAEKELGITGRASIIQYGIDKFNDHCRTSVMKYVEEWRYYVTRQGRWVDFDNDYKTMDKPFMESVLWAFKQLYDKGLVYESLRVMPYSWAAETPLSNFETRLDNATREREDKAAYVKFKLKMAPTEAFGKDWGDVKNIYMVAWTTTPWTLPSNLALAINSAKEYMAILHEGDLLIVADFAKAKFIISILGIKSDETTETLVIKGKDLIGLSYEPLFPYFEDAMTAQIGRAPIGSTPVGGSKKAFTILAADFVVEGDGTGIVHIAPGFGEDDQKLSEANGIPVLVPVDEKGRYTEEIFDLPDLTLRGLNVIAETKGQSPSEPFKPDQVAKYGLANLRIIQWLKDPKRNMLVHQENYKHNYPHCWRTDTPLIYRAMPSWYVEVTKFRERAGEINKKIHWVPEHIRDGQMGHMLATAPDWSISRNRFWGTPIPVWRSKSGKIKVFGSIEEIEKASGQKVSDLHRPMIDEIVIHEGGESYHRVEDVFDCWFESGSMPYAQLHYPFENKEKFEANFPADFITEYIGQTRGWFNTLIMLSTAIFDKEPFEHCICHGVVLDAETGLKYSKRLKNYKDPKEVMDQYGADALRWLMLSSPVMRGADLAVDPEGKFIRDVVRLNIKPIWNAYNFFTLYANADGIKARLLTPSPLAGEGRGEGAGNKVGANVTPPHPTSPAGGEELPILDRYILAKCKAAVEQVKQSLDAYDTPGATEAITGFFEILNNWYIRRSRPRFWAEVVDADKQAAYDTLFTVLNLMVKAAAPLLPFVCEAVYVGLNGAKDSVHWQDFPDVSKIKSEEELVGDMDRVRDACTAMASIRNTENIRNRQPLSRATFYGHGAERLKQYKELMEDELNIKDVGFSGLLVDVAEFKLTINFPVAGKRLGQKMKEVGAAAKAGKWERDGKAIVSVAGEALQPEEYKLEIKPLVTRGAQPLSSNDALVVLDLTITPELEAEGRARDLVRMVQQARKDGGFDVSDRITLALDVPPAFIAAMKAHGDYIKEQTLAVSIAEGKAKSDKQITQELDGETFTIGISKAA